MAKVYCYYRPAGDSGAPSGPSAGGHLMDFGHFVVEVEKGGRRTAFDYWPEGGRSVVRTTLPADRRARHLHLSFFVSDAAADRMIARIKEFERRPPAYDFPLASTCVSRSNELLGLAGLGVDGAMTPVGLWDGLIDRSLRGGQQIWRDRLDERIVFPREPLPRRHGVPLPPPSEQAWLAGQERRWQQQALQALQRQQSQARQLVQQQLQRAEAQRQQQLAQRLLANARRPVRTAPGYVPPSTARSGRRPGTGVFGNPSGPVTARGTAGGAAIGGQSLVNDIHSRFRPTPHRVPLEPRVPSYTVQAGPPIWVRPAGR